MGDDSVFAGFTVIINTLSPVIVSLGPLQIRWYGVMYVLAFLFTYWYAKRRIDQKKAKFSHEHLETILFWLVITMIIGARLFEVLFWQRAYYFANPLKIFAIWEGGLSFHGSLVAMVLTAWWLCRRYNINVLHLADVLIVPLSLGQAFGRIGNFFNHELFGKVSSLPWAVNFNGEVNALGELVFRHPNQLYEAGYNVVIFAVLISLHNRGFRPGTLFALWLVLYATLRFFTEFLRVEAPMLLGLTMGQFFNVFMILTGAGLFYFIYRKK